MINLKDAQITDSLPSIIANQPWAKAVTIKELLEILDQNGNFPRSRGSGEFVHGAMIN